MVCVGRSERPCLCPNQRMQLSCHLERVGLSLRSLISSFLSQFLRSFMQYNPVNRIVVSGDEFVKGVAKGEFDNCVEFYKKDCQVRAFYEFNEGSRRGL